MVVWGVILCFRLVLVGHFSTDIMFIHLMFSAASFHLISVGAVDLLCLNVPISFSTGQVSIDFRCSVQLVQ